MDSLEFMEDGSKFSEKAVPGFEFRVSRLSGNAQSAQCMAHSGKYISGFLLFYALR
jgi:hypothetical protein